MLFLHHHQSGHSSRQEKLYAFSQDQIRMVDVYEVVYERYDSFAAHCTEEPAGGFNFTLNPLPL